MQQIIDKLQRITNVVKDKVLSVSKVDMDGKMEMIDNKLRPIKCLRTVGFGIKYVDGIIGDIKKLVKEIDMRSDSSIVAKQITTEFTNLNTNSKYYDLLINPPFSNPLGLNIIEMEKRLDPKKQSIPSKRASSDIDSFQIEAVCSGLSRYDHHFSKDKHIFGVLQELEQDELLSLPPFRGNKKIQNITSYLENKTLEDKPRTGLSIDQSGLQNFSPNLFTLPFEVETPKRFNLSTVTNTLAGLRRSNSDVYDIESCDDSAGGASTPSTTTKTGCTKKGSKTTNDRRESMKQPSCLLMRQLFDEINITNVFMLKNVYQNAVLGRIFIPRDETVSKLIDVTIKNCFTIMFNHSSVVDDPVLLCGGALIGDEKRSSMIMNKFWKTGRQMAYFSADSINISGLDPEQPWIIQHRGGACSHMIFKSDECISLSSDCYYVQREFRDTIPDMPCLLCKGKARYTCKGMVSLPLPTSFLCEKCYQILISAGNQPLVVKDIKANLDSWKINSEEAEHTQGTE